MKIIFLNLAFVLFAFKIFASFQISGVVTDENKKPLAGANIALSGTYFGTSTDSEGKFQFEHLKAGIYNIKVSFIGYQTIEKEINLQKDFEIELMLIPSQIMADEIIVSATRAGDKTPVSYTTIGKENINGQNLGQDIPYLVSLTPSLVTTSDAGSGVGYTGLRIRGTDATRINVTVNGIPLNDAESHGVWWVNMPDFSSSVNDIQIQRGVGTSTNGAAAFGATVNFQTFALNQSPYAEISSSAGSFSTFKNAIKVGSGLIDNTFSFDVRYSSIQSDGFIDRAASDLQSIFVSGARHAKKSIIKFIIFTGKEKTYQAWNGISSDILKTNRTYNPLGEYLDDNQQIKYYNNQTDNYQQTHANLIFTHLIGKNVNVNVALHYTKGAGYYEEFKNQQSFADYGIRAIVVGSDSVISNIMKVPEGYFKKGSITKTDLIRQKWLDNDFYGLTYSLNYKHNKIDFTFGGAANQYDGRHFGKVIWAKYLTENNFNHEWYRSTGLKNDINGFLKINYSIAKKFNIYTDLQYRRINYSIDGIDDDQRNLTQEHRFNFFNPKIGIYYQLFTNSDVFFSYSVGNREPNRSNYTDADPAKPLPTSERLSDYEFGYSLKLENATMTANLYFMDYTDQLVLTGEINDVGDPVMTNVKDSYRTGFELSAGLKPFSWLSWEWNMMLSKNKIKKFTEYVDNWSYWDDPENQPYQFISNPCETDLAFSPSFVAGSRLDFAIQKNLHIQLSSKFVGKQYIDNTSSDERKLKPYFVNDISAHYSFQTKYIKNIELKLLINNILNEEYESNAWVYRYFENGKAKVLDGYFPQAGINFLAGINLKF
jgi:iron complex outermembrane receptor protein